MRISGLGGRESIFLEAQTKQMTFIACHDLIAAQTAGHSGCGSPSALYAAGQQPPRQACQSTGIRKPRGAHLVTGEAASANVAAVVPKVAAFAFSSSACGT